MGSDDELRQECESVAYRAGRVHQWLADVLRGSVAADRAYAFKGRVKSADDIRNKVLDRRNDTKKKQPNYPATKVTDASGFRIVKLFNAEVPEALEQLLALLETDLPPGKAKGRVKSIKEIEFHTSRRLNDPLSIFQKVKAAVDAHGHELKVQKQEPDDKTASSYSSVHVLLDCEVDSVAACSEIQLRSVFEEAWGEISHRLKYAPEKLSRAVGSPEATDDDMPADFWLHLDALKSLTDGCAQYADLINRQIQRHATGPAERETKPLNPSEKQVTVFQRFGKKLLELTKAAFDRRTKAVNVPVADHAARAAAFHAAADAFQAAVDAFPEPKKDDDARLLDILREENAYCSMFTANAELIARAEKIYRELCVTRPERVSVWLRLGQLRRDAGDYQEAKSLMEQGLKVLATPPADADPETTGRANWLLRRDLAFVCWRLVDREPGRPDAAALLKDAVDYSEKSLEFATLAPQRLNTLLNLLYYQVALWDASPPAGKGAFVSRGREILEELRPQVDFDKWGLEEIDSVMRGEVAFGDPDRAKQAAGFIANKLTKRVAAIRRERNLSHNLAFEALSPDEKDMLLFAQEILGASR